MPDADTILSAACESQIACMSERGLMEAIAQSLATSLDKTAEELLQDACTSGIACLDERDLWIVAAQSIAGETACIITTDSLPNGTDGTPYDQTITATVAATFSIISGALPDGLSMDATGHITGTPTLAGSFNFVVQGTSAGGTCTAPLEINVIPNEPPVFEPPQLADLIAWLKPETLSGLADNDPVDPWPDSGIHGNDFGATSPAETPTWDAGATAVRYDGISQYHLSGSVGTTNTQYTIFAVLQFDGAAGTHGVLRVGDLTGGYGFYKDTGNRGVIHRAVAACTDGAATTNLELWSAVRTEGPNLLRFFLNGVSTVISNSTSNVNTPDGASMFVGIFATAAFLFFPGLIYEVLIYEVPLNDTDRETVENYLIDKYGL